MSCVEFPKHRQPEKQIFVFHFVAVDSYRSGHTKRKIDLSTIIYVTVYIGELLCLAGFNCNYEQLTLKDSNIQANHLQY